MSRWFRFYAEAMRNPKVLRLSDKDFRLWVNLLAVASENDGHIPADDVLKLVLGMRLDHLKGGLNRLISGGLIDALDDGYEPHHWSKFQYKSDTSTERVQKHRAKGNVSETAPETEADTETDKGKRKRASVETALPDDWQPAEFGPDTKSRKIVDSWPPGTLEHQVEHFVAHHRKRGDRFRDWQAAWATWVLNSRKFGNGTDNRKSGGSGGQSRSRDGFLNACADAAMGGHDAGDPFGRPDGGTGDDRPAAVLRLAAHRA